MALQTRQQLVNRINALYADGAADNSITTALVRALNRDLLDSDPAVKAASRPPPSAETMGLTWTLPDGSEWVTKEIEIPNADQVPADPGWQELTAAVAAANGFPRFKGTYWSLEAFRTEAGRANNDVGFILPSHAFYNATVAAGQETRATEIDAAAFLPAGWRFHGIFNRREQASRNLGLGRNIAFWVEDHWFDETLHYSAQITTVATVAHTDYIWVRTLDSGDLEAIAARFATQRGSASASVTTLWSGTEQLLANGSTPTVTIALAEDYRAFDFLAFVGEGEADGNPAGHPNVLSGLLLTAEIPAAEADRVAWLGGHWGQRRPGVWAHAADGTGLKFKAWANAAPNDTPRTLKKVLGVRLQARSADAAGRVWSRAFQSGQGRLPRDLALDDDNSDITVAAAANMLDDLPFTESTIPANEEATIEVAGQAGDLVQAVLLPNAAAAGNASLALHNADNDGSVGAAMLTAASLAAAVAPGTVIELTAAAAFNRVVLGTSAAGLLRVAAVRVLAQSAPAAGGDDDEMQGQMQQQQQLSAYEFISGGALEQAVNLAAAPPNVVAYQNFTDIDVPAAPVAADSVRVNITLLPRLPNHQDPDSTINGTMRLYYQLGNGHYPVFDDDGNHIELSENGDTAAFTLTSSQFDAGTHLELSVGDPNGNALEGLCLVSWEFYRGHEAFKRTIEHVVFPDTADNALTSNGFATSRATATQNMLSFSEPFRLDELDRVDLLYGITNSNNDASEQKQAILTGTALRKAGVLDVAAGHLSEFMTNARGRVAISGWTIGYRTVLFSPTNGRIDTLRGNAQEPFVVFALRQSGAYVSGMQAVAYTDGATVFRFYRARAYLRR